MTLEFYRERDVEFFWTILKFLTPATLLQVPPHFPNQIPFLQ